ncbi:hypothetical protein DRN73_05275 [Candidatus Pacearchaeota archaeon]|nr:MAG: hypothetical protein DRN73_05275 [Candidatus Pacearchaeota archaeon]
MNFQQFKDEYLKIVNFKNKDFKNFVNFVSRNYRFKRIFRYKKQFAIFVPHQIISNVVLCSHFDTVIDNGKVYIDRKKEVFFGAIKGDCRAGVLMMLKLSEKGRISILFNGEETGAWGVRKFCEKFNYIQEKIPELRNISFFIEFDRKGRGQFICYNHDNKDLKNLFIENGFIEEEGIFSDISVIEENLNYCGINLSIGYYNNHTEYELLKFEDWLYTYEKVQPIISKFYDKFEFVEKIKRKYWDFDFDRHIYYEQKEIEKDWDKLKKYLGYCEWCGSLKEVAFDSYFQGYLCKDCYFEVREELSQEYF